MDAKQQLKVSLKEIDQQAQVRLAAIVNSSDDAIIGKTLEGIITSWNPGAEKVFGYSAAEAIGQPMLMLFPPEHAAEEKEILAKIGRGESVKHFETVRVRKDGKRIHVSITLSPIIDGNGKIIGASKIARDITERMQAEKSMAQIFKEAQERTMELKKTNDALQKEIAERKLMEGALHESERRFCDMLGKIQLVSMMLDNSANITYCNDYLLRITGWRREEVLGKNWFETFLPQEIQDKIKNVFSELITNRPEAWHYQNEITTRSGKRRIIRWNNSILRSPSGEIVGTASIGEDVTDREIAERALRESEEKFRQLAENIQEVFWMTSPNFDQILYVSPAYEKIWGRTCASLYAAPHEWIEAIHPEDKKRIHKAAVETIPLGTFDVEYRIIRPDGGMRWIHDRGFPVRDANGEIYRVVGVAEDVTDRKKLEEQFRQSQKMEAIGQLAGGVAHDFNNILAVISMQSELLKSSGGLSADQSEFADEIGITVQRAAALTRQLLLFSRREVFQPRDLDLSESITNTAKMLRRILGENIQMQLKLASQPMFINADAGMMDQVLMNLCVNARDAMPNGGQLVIETSGVEFDEFAAAQSAQVRVGSFVRLSVSDSGCGIPPENLPKIFEPFFTTKDVGKGTGLGLATVFGIVQQHQGWINVYSEVNHGTTFRIYLPRLAKNGGHKSSQLALTELRGGNETILLAEDDPSLRISVRKALSQLGYRILEAPTGVKALEVWKQNRDEIRLLLTDLVMPDGMTGKDLAQRILQENPKLKVIYMSGYSAEVVGKDFPLKEGVNFLTKPFQAAKLAQTIRTALDA